MACRLEPVEMELRRWSAGVIKIVHDVALLLSFCHITPPEERNRARLFEVNTTLAMASDVNLHRTYRNPE
jgi:hypothetical protein